MELLLSSGHCEDSPKEFMASWGKGSQPHMKDRHTAKGEGWLENKAGVRMWLCVVKAFNGNKCCRHEESNKYTEESQGNGHDGG